MTILFDIGHPAHVHYFKNLIQKEKSNGNRVIVTARNKEVSYALLDYYGIEYLPRGKGGKNLLTKFFYMFWADLVILVYAMKNNVDIFISFASPYAAQVAWLLRKPHIALTDTENASLGILSFLPFSSVVLTPDCFQKDLGMKHLRFKAYMETSYIREIVNTNPRSNLCNEPYVIVRFVSWNANHDVGQKGFDIEDKKRLIKSLSNYIKVYISSESNLPEDLINYKLNIHPADMHEALFNAELYIGEGATMASEAALMGTPAIYVNSLGAGTLEKQQKSGLLFCYLEIEEVIKKSIELIQNATLRLEYKHKAKDILKTQVNLIHLLSWFINNYPQSQEIMTKDNNYQDRFIDCLTSRKLDG